MRYIVNSDNFVVAVSFGSDVIYNDCFCTEYIGGIPKNYSSLEEWYLKEELTLWRWKIVDGNLTLDSSAVAPEEGQWGVPELQSKTVTPTTSEQTVTADEDYDGLEKVVVNSIPSSYVLPRYTRSTATIIPGTSDQIIEAGTYCSGRQIIEGDSDLIASNIKKGANIFGRTGTCFPRIEKLSGTPMSFCDSTSKFRLTVNTTNLIGFSFVRNSSVSQSEDDSSEALFSGFIDLINNRGQFSSVASDGSTTASYSQSIPITKTSGYLEFIDFPFRVYVNGADYFVVMAIYSE